jgi:heme oxygenase
MTPANYEYSKVFLNLKISKKEYSKILKERYLWLIANKQRLELHVHLSPIMNISYKEQNKLITESIKWMEKEIGVKVKEMAPGWWMSNKDTKQILDKLGVKLVKFKDYRAVHDYDWVIR